MIQITITIIVEPSNLNRYIKHRCEVIDKENDAIEYAKKKGGLYVPKILDNGDTLKQILVRSRYLL